MIKAPGLLHRLSINQRLALLVLSPVLVLTLVLAAYQIPARLHDLHSELRKRTATIAHFLASASEVALFAQDAQSLKQLARSTREHREVEDILFIAPDGRIIYQAGRTRVNVAVDTGNGNGNDGLRIHQPNPRQLMLHQEPVFLAPFDGFLDGQPRQSKGNEDPVGWVVILIDEAFLLTRQNEILLHSLLILAAGLLLTFWLAVAIGRSITGPLQCVIHTVEQLRGDNNAARVDAQAGGEMGELQQGINSLAEQVQRTREKLEDEVARSTHSLRTTLNQMEDKNQQLATAKREADAANHSKDAFLARMSHELRTPLTSILGFVRLLRKTDQSHDQAEYSRIIQRTSALLLNLIDDLLDFSKLQSEAILLEQIPFSLEHCIEDVMEMQAPSADEKGLDMFLHCDPRLGHRQIGDPTRISQVLSNLIANAIKFTHQGEIRVVVDVVRFHPRAVDLQMTISDTGMGMDQESRQRLFQPFIQADTSISRRYGGSGLGLVISKHLLELMGGSIDLHSKPGQGTEVSVNLTLPVDPAGFAYTDLSHQRLLLCDPVANSYQATYLQCQKWRCRVEQVADYHDLPDLLEQGRVAGESPPDAIVLGVSSDGLKALLDQQFFNRLQRCFNGTLILISGPLNTHCQTPCDQLQAQYPGIRLLSKPISHGKLLECLNPPAGVVMPCLPCEQPSRPLQGMRVLVAEDNWFNQLLLERMLQAQGAVPIIVGDGRQVIDALACAVQPFAAVLMDIQMPVMGGIETSRQIRQLHTAAARIPIIVLSASVISSEKQTLQQLGVTRVLLKPLNEQQLVSSLRDARGAPPADSKTPGPVVQDPIPLSGAQTPVQIRDYGLTQQDLDQELASQLQAIHQAFANHQRDKLAEHAHQLLGLASLYEITELESAVRSFSTAVNAGSARALWRQLWRLQRVMHTLDDASIQHPQARVGTPSAPAALDHPA